LLVLSHAALIAAETRQELRERERLEWEKFRDQMENRCIGSGEAWFSYAPLDRTGYHPIHFSPDLRADLVKRITAVLPSLQDPKVREALDGALNDEVNQRLDGLRSGRLNNINLVVAKGIGVSITPMQHQSEDVLVWVPRSTMARLRDVVGGVAPTDTLFVLLASGSIRPVGDDEKPKWVTATNLREYLWSGAGGDRVRIKKMVRCSYQPLPK
jgi:hypothetical protein